MKSVLIIAIAVGLVAIVAVYVIMYDAKPWVGLDCDEMIDFSGSDEHHLMGNSMHMKFHSYYFDHCSETELGKP